MSLLLLLLLPLCWADIRNTDTVQTYDGLIKYNEDWGYTDIRPGAHTFWWLYARDGSDEDNADRPLFLWLQGGPGSSSVGYGNFEELGPKAMDGSDNEGTWLQKGDLIFVDNPVGTGFSYVDSKDKYTTDVASIGQDLLAWARDFFDKHKEYRTRPFYIVCESYGGKMTAEFAKQLYLSSQVGDVPLTRFIGVGLGDSWISPMDFVNSWGPYLYAQSYLDAAQLNQTQALAHKWQTMVDNNKFKEATQCWSSMEDLIGVLTDGVSWYNVLKQGGDDDWSMSAKRLRTNRITADEPQPTHLDRLYARHVRPLQLDALTDYMNTVVRQKLGIIPDNVSFGAQSSMVFNKQEGDFMRPNYNTVDDLLLYGLQVTVFNGQLDLICDTIGTENWLNRLGWAGQAAFRSAQKKSFGTKSYPLAGYVKSHANLDLVYVLRAGHMVAHDTPESALFVLDRLIAKA